VILLSADGVTGPEIARRLDVTPEAVSRIRRRFEEGGVVGLPEQPRSGHKDSKTPPDKVERIVQLALSPPSPGRSRWTTPLLDTTARRCTAPLTTTSGREWSTCSHP
jgi:transposase